MIVWFVLKILGISLPKENLVESSWVYWPLFNQAKNYKKNLKKKKKLLKMVQDIEYANFLYPFFIKEQKKHTKNKQGE